MITFLQSTDDRIVHGAIEVDDTAHLFLKGMFNEGMLNVTWHEFYFNVINV